MQHCSKSVRDALFAVSLPVLLLLAPAAARAQSTWAQPDAALGPYAWNTTANWTGGVPSGTSSIANFGATTGGAVGVNFGGAVTVGQFNILDGSYAFDGGSLTFTTMSVATGSDVTFNANLLGSGAITKSGAGTFTLATANTGFTGGLTVNGGVVDILANTGITQPVVVNGGGSLKIHTLAGLGAAGAGLTLNSGSQMSFQVASGSGGAFSTGPVAISGDVTVNIGRDTAGSTVIATIPSLSFAAGTNTLAINNLNVTSGGIVLQVSGTTTVSGNTTLNLVPPGATSNQVFMSVVTGSGSLTLGGSPGNSIAAINADSPAFTGSVHVDAANGKFLIQGNTGMTGTSTVSGGALRIKKSGSLGGTSFASAGKVTMTGGSLDLFVDGSVGFFVDLNVQGDVTLLGTRASSASFLNHTVGKVAIGFNTFSTTAVTTGGSPVTIGYTFTTQAVTLSGSAVFNVGQVTGTTGILNLGAVGQSTPGQGLTKMGQGTLVLAGANTFTGSTVVSAGTLRASGSNLGPVTVGTTGTLAVGTALAANQWTAGSTAFNGGATLLTTLYGLGSSDISLLSVTGNVTVGPSARLALDLAAVDADTLRTAVGSSRTYTVIQGSGTVGSFAVGNLDLVNPGNFQSGEWAVAANPAAGTVQLVFTPVPEPGLALALAAAGLVMIRRRRIAAV